MKPRDISQASNPDLRASMAAMRRAAERARAIAIQTDTAVIRLSDCIVNITAAPTDGSGSLVFQMAQETAQASAITIKAGALVYGTRLL